MAEFSEVETPLVFKYSDGDLLFTSAINNSPSPSKFDNELCSKWDQAMDKGHFKYNLKSVETKIIPGKLGFVAQLNEKRFTHRRQPQHITSLNQPFNAENFNFTKVYKREILLSLSPEHRSIDGRHIIVINVSPFCYGNVLLVPNADGHLPQVLTEPSIILSLEMILLTNKRNFYVGFNSLCGYASVNHLHLHAFYSPHVLPVEHVQVIYISSGFYETVDYPNKAFVFECCDIKSIPSVARSVYQVTSYLQQNELAHSVFFTHASQHTTNKCDVLRIFIWVRKPSTGIKNEHIFNIAVCELAGFLPVKERTWFDNFTEKDVCEYFKDAALKEEQFDKIRNEILKKLRS